MEHVVLGVDPHKPSATIEVVDHRESSLDSGPSTTDQNAFVFQQPIRVGQQLVLRRQPNLALGDLIIKGHGSLRECFAARALLIGEHEPSGMTGRFAIHCHRGADRPRGHVRLTGPMWVI